MSINNDVDVSISTDLHSMEKLWARELYELSLKERETISDELHGVSVSDKNANHEKDWSEEQYRFCLDAFQDEVNTKIPFEDKQSYLTGLELRSSYITSSDFRLGFLRTERYDIEKAAKRYCRCLNFLMDFFGKFALMRPLLMSDLTKKETKFLREGYVQILPSRDRLGRRILVQLGSYGGDQYSELEKFRVNVYLIFSILSTDVTGVVSLASFTRGAESAMRGEAGTISKLIKTFFAAVPLRWSAAHLCIPDDPMFHMLKALVLFFLGLNGRRMLRIHTGTPLECDYKLRSFGIPTGDIPRTHTHTIKVKNHNRLIKVLRAVDTFVEKSIKADEVTNIRFPGIECPEINCVLFGRYAWDHPGNVEFRGLLQELFMGTERDVDRADQIHSMVKDVIEESLSRKFRFLMYDRTTYLYEEITDYGEVWALVEQAIKEDRKRRKAKRMVDETKFVIGRDIDRFVDVENSGVSTMSLMGQKTNKCGKFMKDCNGCRR
eukprot:CAMPEP_0116157070 /NCGR_PEP_ID=MMETSP0329-20121206/23154_1 /TAXON_ID=697910 /ORGANISM="Pseudo-nitzschia arenysensis, Strain B593" /LENGTH=492 /DNA_ID=CAMNT_0003654165 /DNA_START=65 /DNA_END=1540 /DNA_ORIENTATION=-